MAGNILSRTTYTYTTGSVDGLTPLSTLTYSYGNSVWKDQLTAFNGTAITYDDLGNPLSYNGMTFTWEKGRQLSGLSATGLSASYTYNDAGIRTSKTVNNVTTTYQLNGDKVTAEITGNQIIYYTYDASGQVVTMSVNGAEYYYVRNGQNDVIALVTSGGSIAVNYTYSTYGEVLITTGSLSTTIGALNPYRYRGYRYDNESGLYYLQSRYYNPVWGRFINADGIVGANQDRLAYNLYAYSSNNPVNFCDPSGMAKIWTRIGILYNGSMSDFKRLEAGLPPAAFERLISTAGTININKTVDQTSGNFGSSTTRTVKSVTYIPKEETLAYENSMLRDVVGSPGLGVGIAFGSLFLDAFVTRFAKGAVKIAGNALLRGISVISAKMSLSTWEKDLYTNAFRKAAKEGGGVIVVEWSMTNSYGMKVNYNEYIGYNGN